MREAIRVDELVDGRNDVLVPFDVCQRVWSVFFHPGRSQLHTLAALNNNVTDHGNVSSASTGRLAALLLPFFASPPKLIEVSATGASRSEERRVGKECRSVG